MMEFHELRHRIAKRLYQPHPSPPGSKRPAWEDLTRNNQQPWLEDAGIAIILTIEACCKAAEEHGASEVVPYLKGLYAGNPADDPMPCRSAFR